MRFLNTHTVRLWGFDMWLFLVCKVSTEAVGSVPVATLYRWRGKMWEGKGAERRRRTQG